MNKLLRAGYSRLFRDVVFLLAVAAMFLLGSVAAATQCREAAEGYHNADMANNIFSYAVFVSLAMSVVSAMYTGAEFDNGTIRNKLMIGHRRRDIYLSQFLFMAAAGILCSMAYVIPHFIICRIGLGPTSLPIPQLLTYGAMALCTVLAYAALFNFITMLTGKRAVAAVVCMLLVIAMIMAASIINNKLSEPEFYTNYVLTAEGRVEPTDAQPNPFYIPPAVRPMWELVFDLLPEGQSIQLASIEAERPLRLILCALGETVVFTLGGLALFRRKDLK